MRTGKVKQRQSKGDKQELQAEEEEGGRERARGEREGLGEWDAVCTCMPVRG